MQRITVDYMKLVSAVKRLLGEREAGEHLGQDLYLQAVREVLGDPKFVFGPGERQVVKSAMYVHIYSTPAKFAFTKTQDPKAWVPYCGVPVQSDVENFDYGEAELNIMAHLLKNK